MVAKHRPETPRGLGRYSHTETEDEIHVISMREGDNDEQLLFFANLR